MSTPDQLWSFTVRPEDVPETGAHFDLAPSENARAAMAKAGGLLALPHMEAHFDVRRRGRDGLAVTGTVEAEVVQACVVTLEPVAGTVREEIDTTFVPPGAHGAQVTEPEHESDADPPDPPEELVGGAADLGALAAELLMLGLDPYPRKEGAVFVPPEPAVPRESPFAALAALRSARKGSQ
ncbi:MAG: DUF177 domain-containing protein [Variibacter sp.]|nr:DUF177 domain-containing protein [Variibacter sp.]